MQIRQERPDDHEEVRAVVKAAFATTSNDGEWDYLDEVRQKDAFVPSLSLVAVERGAIVGQIVLYETDIVAKEGTVTQLVLSPLSVHPAHFGRGIATALMQRAFALAADMGYGAVFLCGDPAFYRRAGFKPSWEHGIYHAADTGRQAEWCMALELRPGALRGIEGTVDIV